MRTPTPSRTFKGDSHFMRITVAHTKQIEQRHQSRWTTVSLCDLVIFRFLELLLPSKERAELGT